MADVSLAVEVRADFGKGPSRRLRAAGRIPGILYGQGRENVAISLDAAKLENLIKSSHAGINTLIDLEGAGDVAGRTVMVKELQRDPVRGEPVHADLYEIDATSLIRVSVPIHLRGTAIGVTMGGLIDHALRAVELDCLPNAIPDEIVVDVTELEQGQSIHVSDLVLPDGVELHASGELPVVSVVAPKVEEEAVLEAEEGVEGEGEAAAAREAEGASEGEGGESQGS